MDTRISFEELTELIVCSGYEERLTRDEANWDSLRDLYSNNKVTPLTTGGRILTPEEVDNNLAAALGRRANYNRVTSKSNDMCETDELFTIFDVDKSSLKSTVWRNRQMAKRNQLIKEVREICSHYNQDYSFDSGVCFRLKHCMTPFALVYWLKKRNYCGCFSIVNTISMNYIACDDHNILIMDIDAESG